MSEKKKETAIRKLSKTLRRRFQGAAVHISWVELDAFLNIAQQNEMINIHDAYNGGYNDCKNGFPNQTQIESDESNTNL